MPRMTKEEQAEFEKKHPLNTMIIFGVKPPKWWLGKYENASRQGTLKTEKAKDAKKQ